MPGVRHVDGTILGEMNARILCVKVAVIVSFEELVRVSILAPFGVALPEVVALRLTLEAVQRAEAAKLIARLTGVLVVVV